MSCETKCVCCFSSVSGLINKTVVQPQCSTVAFYYLHFSFILKGLLAGRAHASGVYVVCAAKYISCVHLSESQGASTWWRYHQHCLMWTPAAAGNQLLDTGWLFQPSHTYCRPSNSNTVWADSFTTARETQFHHQMSPTGLVLEKCHFLSSLSIENEHQTTSTKP